MSSISVDHLDADGILTLDSDHPISRSRAITRFSILRSALTGGNNFSG
jgi:hypothetical protein